MSLAVVIATCRPESIRRWLDAWRQELQGTQVYVVEDCPDGYAGVEYPGNADIFNWRNIDRDLGTKSWIIPRRSSAIKSYGFLKAHQDGHDIIWTLDDDCFPEPDREYPTRALMEMSLRYDADVQDRSWWNTIDSTGLYPRGYPYGIRQKTEPTMIHHGLWSGVPDLDGITALEHAEWRMQPTRTGQVVPRGAFFPMCGMNLAFRRDMTPAMYFGLQGHWKDLLLADSVVNPADSDGLRSLPFDRFDDIWAGLFAKKVCDHLGYAVTSGAPSILHTKESDPIGRVLKEGPGIAANEVLWERLADYRIPFGLNTVRGCYDAVAEFVNFTADDLPFPYYWHQLAEAMHIWGELTA